MVKTIDEKIDELALSMAAGFEGMDKKFEAVDKRLDVIEKKVNNLENTVSNLPDKAYLDDKLADVKGDIVVKLRREDEKMNFLISLLRERSVLTEKDVQRLRREFEVFPSLG
ncbi:MAG: hypothetical protein EXS55_04680 [Candidatus Magasanikbacteria bacterium]|nr:hypothetical protein [Candidatus Magasanikbacteria bacterium]